MLGPARPAMLQAMRILLTNDDGVGSPLLAELATALDELERRGLSTALVTLCIGGGQGIATILERS